MASIKVMANEPEYLVVAHPSVSVDSISTNQLRRVFSGRQPNWPDGARITVYVYKNNHPVHVGFSKQVLFMFPYQLERVWNTKTYSGQGDRPIVVDSEAQMLERVKNEPGAIGYIRAVQEVTEVKVLKIEDKS